MDPNFSRKNIFLYHDNPNENPLIFETTKHIEKNCNIHLSMVRAREVQYAKPLMVALCPIVTKTDQDVNALLNSSRDGQDVLLVMIKRAPERARNRDGLSHLSDPLSTTTRNRVGAACTLYFSGREKFKGYKNENSLALNEIKRVVNLALDQKPWSTSFPGAQMTDLSGNTSAPPSGYNQPRPIQFVDSTQLQQDEFHQQLSRPSQPQLNSANPFQTRPSQLDPFQTTKAFQVQIPQQSQTAIQNQPIHQQSQPMQIKPKVPEINIIPPSQSKPAGDPFIPRVPDPMPESQSQDKITNDDDDFFDPRGDFNKKSANPFRDDPFDDAFAKLAENKHSSANLFDDAFVEPRKEKETLNFPKPEAVTAVPKEIQNPVYYFFDETSPLEQDTVDFVEEHGKFALKRCRRQTATVVSPLLVFSPCYTIPDADAKSVLGQCRDGDDVFVVVIQPVHSHNQKQPATLSDGVQRKIGSYGVLAYSMDTKSFRNTDNNCSMINKLRDFILDKQKLSPQQGEENDDDDDDDVDNATNVLTLEGFNELGFDESEA